VCDFGLSKAFVVNRNTPKVCSLNYRAPELLLKKTDYTMSIDIWALGCVFYEFLTQKTLFVVANKQELLNEIQRLNKKQSSKYKNNLLKYVPEKYKIPISKHMLCYDPLDRSSIIVIAKLLNYKLAYTNYIPYTPNDKNDYIFSDSVSKLSSSSLIIKNRLKNRKHMLKLISDLALSENFFDETIYLAYELMDRYMSQCNKMSEYDKYTLATSVTTNNNVESCNYYKTRMTELDIVAISSLRLASKFLEIHPYQLDRLELTLIQKNIIYQCEKSILCSLKWIVYTASFYEILKTYVTSELNSVGNKTHSDVEPRNSVLSQPRATEEVPNNVESRNSALSQPRANEGVLERRKKLAKYMYKNYDISKQSHLQIKNTIATIFSYKE
jgi:serine/threonine protein kinase